MGVLGETFQTRGDWDKIYAPRSREEEPHTAVSRKVLSQKRKLKANATVSKVIMGSVGFTVD